MSVYPVNPELQLFVFYRINICSHHVGLGLKMCSLLDNMIFCHTSPTLKQTALVAENFDDAVSVRDRIPDEL
jgi:hypothetical protein